MGEDAGEFGVNTILMPPSSPLTGALKESSRWRVVYDDGVSLVFRQRTGGETISAAGTDGPSKAPTGRRWWIRPWPRGHENSD